MGIVALSASAAFAQTTPLIIDRGRIDRQEGMAPPPQKAPDGLRGRTSVDQSAPAQEGTPIRAVKLHGSSLSLAETSRAWSNKIGQPLDRTTIEAIAADLSKIYTRSDIALFTILVPAQDLNDGQLDLVVIEGHITDVVIQTGKPKSKDIELIKEYAAELPKERPLRRVTLERYLSLMRDIPGETMEAQLIPAQERGGARLVILPKFKRIDAGFGMNNRGTALLGRTQVTLDASYNGLLRSGDQTSLIFAMPTQDNLFTYVGLSHSTPVGANGMRLNLSAGKLKTRLKSGIDGDAETANVSVTYPIIRSYTRNLSASFGVDLLDSTNAAFGQMLDSSTTRTLRAGLSYGKNTQTSAAGLSASISKGLDIWDASVNPFAAQADFTKFSAQGGFDKLWFDRFGVRLRAAAQLSGDILPASEQMALGGQAFGRAYEGAVVQGDKALAGSIEGAYRFSKLLPDWMSGTEAYVFADTGKVWLNQRPLWPSGFDFTLSSAGFGTRLALSKKTTVGLEYAQGLEAPYPGIENEWRFSYSIVSRH